MKTVILVLTLTICLGQNALSYTASYESKANALYNEGKYELSFIFFEKAFADNPTNPRINFYLGNLYNHKKNFAKSIQAFKRGLENVSSKEDKLQFLYNIARTYQANKQYKEALIVYDKIDKSSQYKDIALHKGMIFLNLKNKEQTINEWENYLVNASLSPEYESVAKAINILRQKDFKWEEVAAKSVREEDKKIVEDVSDPKERPLSKEEIKEAQDKLVKELKNKEIDEVGKVVDREASKVTLEKEDNIKLSDHLDSKESNYEEIER